jgi:hypothetical protein
MCALSKNWTFEPKIRRWSRVEEIGSFNVFKNSDASKPSSRASSPEG